MNEKSPRPVAVFENCRSINAGNCGFNIDPRGLDYDIKIINSTAENSRLDNFRIAGDDPTEAIPPKPSMSQRARRFLGSVSKGAIGGAIGNWMSGG